MFIHTLCWPYTLGKYNAGLALHTRNGIGSQAGSVGSTSGTRTVAREPPTTPEHLQIRSGNPSLILFVFTHCTSSDPLSATPASNQRRSYTRDCLKTTHFHVFYFFSFISAGVWASMRSGASARELRLTLNGPKAATTASEYDSIYNGHNYYKHGMRLSATFLFYFK